MATIITPHILGHGRAGTAIFEAIQILRPQMKDITWSEPIWIERGAELKPQAPGLSLALISNPNGLHADRILEAHRNGFHAIGTEKPACTDLHQAAKLSEVTTKTAVFHVYREMWGPQTLKEMLSSGELGELIAIEGRYWQSSTAERALLGTSLGTKQNSWKNDLSLCGPSDALLDVGTHWVDMAVFMAGGLPSKVAGWASYANAEAPHRDTHVHLILEFAGGRRGLASISKTFHGATNHFEINLIGTRGSATWTFLNPDEIFIGRGRDRRVLTRKTTAIGTGHPPFHAMGWLEGYVEILKQLVLDMTGQKKERSYPELRESVALVKSLLEAQILRN